jgi:hypothetical protein
MPLIGPIPEGGTFFCPHCGALYSVTYSRLSKSDGNIAKCVDSISSRRWHYDMAYPQPFRCGNSRRSAV